jgi:hypothetical protein
MPPKCIGAPHPAEEKQVHPLYLFTMDKVEDATGHVCATSFYMEGDEIMPHALSKRNAPYGMDNNDFDIQVFLYTTYNIKDLNDAVAWCRANQQETTATLARVMDLAWDAFLHQKDVDDEATDGLVSVYQQMLAQDNAMYPHVDRAVREVVAKHLGNRLSYHAGQSYYKLIKKYLSSSID